VSEATAPLGQIADDDDDSASAFIESAAREAAADASAAGPQGIDQDAIVNQLLEKLSPQLNGLLDKRVSGFQQLLERERTQREEAESKLREFEVAGLSEDERLALQQQERDEEVERLRLENELFRLQEQHPKGATIYRRLLEPGLTAQQQVALLDEMLAAQGGGQSPAPSPTPPAPTPEGGGTVPVDRNNPAHNVGEDVMVLPNGEIMSDEIADRILRTERWGS
jgi:hypothetical protein